jgi:hypothetical protein
MPDEKDTPLASPVPDAGAGEGKKETAPEATASASSTKSKSTAKKKSSGKKEHKTYGEIRINPTTVVRYNREGSKDMNLPTEYVPLKTVG